MRQGPPRWAGGSVPSFVCIPGFLQALCTRDRGWQGSRRKQKDSWGAGTPLLGRRGSRTHSWVCPPFFRRCAQTSSLFSTWSRACVGPEGTLPACLASFLFIYFLLSHVPGTILDVLKYCLVRKKQSKTEHTGRDLVSCSAAVTVRWSVCLSPQLNLSPK